MLNLSGLSPSSSHAGGVQSLALLPPTREAPLRFVSGGSDHKIKIWNVSTSNGEEYCRISPVDTDHTNMVTELQYNESKSWLLSGGSDNKVRFCYCPLFGRIL
jgi:WD40 repeat protein